MGIFDSLKNKEKESKPIDLVYCPQNEQNAWIALMTIVLRIDGQVTDSETNLFAKFTVGKTFFDGFDTIFYFKESLDIFSKQGIIPILNGCIPYISKENAPTLFCLLVDLALADGHLFDTEEQLLIDIKNRLGIDDDVAEKIISVLELRAKYDIDLHENR